MKDIILAIVEDDTIIRDSLEQYFSSQDDILFSFAENSVEAFCQKVIHSTNKPNVILLDISLPGITGIEGIPKIKKLLPGVAIVMNTIHNDNERIFNSFRAGADGYILKNISLSKIKDGLMDIRSNGAPMSPSIAKKVINYFRTPDNNKANTQKEALTNREKQVVDGLVDGLTYKKIADHLGISLETVRHHIKNIYSKLNVNNKSQVVVKSLRGEI